MLTPEQRATLIDAMYVRVLSELKDGSLFTIGSAMDMAERLLGIGAAELSETVTYHGGEPQKIAITMPDGSILADMVVDKKE